MKGQKKVTRRDMLKLSGTVAAGSLLAACAPVVPQVVKETVLVPQIVPPVKETVLVQAPTSAPIPTSAPAAAAAAGPVTLEVFDPFGATNVSQVFAPRMADLNGKTVCLVSTGLTWQGYRILPRVGELLQKQFPTVKIIPYTEFPVGSAAIDSESTAALVKAKGCDAAIVGNAG